MSDLDTRPACPITDTPPSFPFDMPPGLEMIPEYAVLREEAPITKVRLPQGEAWLVTRYADVRRIVTDNRFSRALACDPSAPRITAVPLPNTSIVSMDPPLHTRVRSIVTREFTVRRVEKLRAATEQILEGLLDRMAETNGPADFVDAVAQPFPASVVGELFGVSEADREAFQDWSRQLLGLSTASEGALSALGSISEYFRGMVTDRRERMTEDLISGLVRAHDEHGKLTDDELVSFGVILLVAGSESTTDQMANSVYTLLTEDGQYRRLRDDPSLVPTAVEELLRYVPLGSGSGLPYMATVDVEFDDVVIRAGDVVAVSYVSANRDPAAFPEPDTLDLMRSPNAHVGFGYGTHHCLGAQLARMQLQVLFTSLPRRFPDLALAVPPEQVQWKRGQLNRGPVSLPVSW